jgi:hypothetical protein
VSVAPNGCALLLVVSNTPSDWRVAIKFRCNSSDSHDQFGSSLN